MSRPRYTCAESQVTISTGNSRASASATSLLPVPVGPVSTAIGRCMGGAWSGFSGLPGCARATGSAPAQEHPVELAERDLSPGGTPVIALIRARRLLHLPQQRVHLRDREPPVRMDRGAACDGA